MITKNYAKKKKQPPDFVKFSGASFLQNTFDGYFCQGPDKHL